MRRIIFTVLLSLLIFQQGFADEGMWLPSLVSKLNIADMQRLGFKLSADDLYNINNASLKDAIVALDHGSCTAELVSAEGLLLTNHHCGYDEIQTHSSVDHDYLKDGFWAMSRNEELPNPGKSVTFLVSVEDVTAKVLEGVTAEMSEDERNAKIQTAAQAIQTEAKKGTHYESYVRSFFNNNQYFLFITETFRDVRLVGAPPEALGKFGGDTDNWMWPRQTCDFALFRIYSGPDGLPADYSEENIPYKAKYYLPVSIKGVKDGDFAMIMGYPGGTNRYDSSFGVKYIMDVTNPTRIDVRERKLQIIDDYMATSAKARIQYASKHARSSNYHKYSIGQNRGLERLHIVDQKRAVEDTFEKWIAADSERSIKYGEALSMIEKAYDNVDAEKAREYMAEALIRGPEIFIFAYRMLPLSRRLKEGVTKDDDLLEMVKSELKATLDDYFKDYDAETDRKISSALLQLYGERVDQKFHPSFYSDVMKKYRGNFDKFTKKMYKKSIFTDYNAMVKFLENPVLRTLEKDMAFKATTDIFDMLKELNEEISSNRKLLDRGNRLFLAGLMEMQQERVFYPDANSTMRLTYGQVLDYEPMDGVIYKYSTTVDGYLEKEIPGDDEFDVPERLKKMILDRDFGRYGNSDGTLNACFISNNDITGGNSGSPVLNAEGQLTGIAFDGNWEAMSGDITFEPMLQRCINVDIRFVLWVIDKYAGATHLIEEMKIVN